MKVNKLFVMPFLFLFSATNLYAENGVSMSFNSDYTVVISQGDLEDASIGTYSIAVFKDKNHWDFVAGGIFPRNGYLFQDNGRHRIEFADITGDGQKEIIITILTAGSGNYTQVDALQLNEKLKTIERIAQIQSDTKQDNIKRLKKLIEKH